MLKQVKGTEFYGCQLLSREWDKLSQREAVMYQSIEAVIVVGSQLHCQRCDQKEAIEKCRLPSGLVYCPNCLLLGRCDSSQQLYRIMQPPNKERTVIYHWKGALTKHQASIAQALKRSVKKKENRLIWAVTGAGKTEMLYSSIQFALSKGERVAIASPRVDVCNELYLRLREVWPEEDTQLLHGDTSIKAYRYSALIICTTHQLYRFYQAFDVLIIDEIDAFPFAGDLGLAYAVQQAKKKSGSLIYLTATPDGKLLKDVASTFLVSRLPLRFHERPLPEPELYFWNQWYKKTWKKRRAKRLLILLKQLAQKNDVLVFCPSIRWMEQLKTNLCRWLPQLAIESVSSVDPKRKEKVQKMRDGEYNVLLTTTILERGVTFSHLSVVVLGAEHPVFTKASLVQIAGRADRKGSFSDSRVCFFYHERTTALNEACREIRQMNEEGRQLLSCTAVVAKNS